MAFTLFSKKPPYVAAEAKAKFQKVLGGVAHAGEVAFDVTHEDHIQKVIDCTAALNQYLPVLKNRDTHIASGFATATVALALASIIPFGLTIAMAGVAYASYWLGGRDEPYNKFTAALEELAHCCDWALSEALDDESYTAKVNTPAIKAMLLQLAPYVTKADLIDIMGSEKEAANVELALSKLHAEEPATEAGVDKGGILNLNKPVAYQLATTNDLTYHLYGYKQGGSLATLANVVRIYAQKAFAYVYNLIQNTFFNHETDNHALAPK